jgi:hypothetical protein
MNEQHTGVESLADLEWDLAGSRARAAWVTCLGSQGASTHRTIAVRPRAPRTGEEPTGEALVAHRPPPVRARYQTVHWLEGQFTAAPADTDYGCLIASACQVLESELDDLLVDPARGLAPVLIEALRMGGKGKQADLLGPWAEGQFPATIGTASIVLMGLRYASAAGSEECVRFLEKHFRPRYTTLSRSKELGATLDTIRNVYRNPACHGLRPFGPAEYQTFARLVVARERFTEWTWTGPRLTDPAGALGLLHHHLAGSARQVPESAPAPEPSPVERLTALAKPRGSGLAIRLELVRDPAAALPAVRDLTPVRLNRPVRVGDVVVFRFRADRPCGVALIDIGTSGAVSVVLPNRWVRAATVPAEQPVLFPDPQTDEFDFEVSGPPGIERVVAVGWEGRLSVPLAPDGEHPFRSLAPDQVAAFCSAVSALAPDRWGACAVEFEVGA